MLRRIFKPLEKGRKMGRRIAMIFSHAKRTSVAGRLAGALAITSATGALAIALAAPALAQESNASLRGSVTGATQITAVDVATGFRRTIDVTQDGRYNFPQLRPATYYLEITGVDGTVRRTDEFTLQIAQDAVLDFDDIAQEPTVADASATPRGRREHFAA
jgi:hypothetical protein